MSEKKITKKQLKEAFDDFGIKKEIADDFISYIFDNLDEPKIKLKEKK